MPYKRATNSTAIAWNSALPARLMLAPSGSTKLETGRGICRSLSAASIMFGRAAIEVVAEKATIMEGNAARRNRRGARCAISATLGR